MTVLVEVTDLEPGVSYVFSVSAENRFGSSNFSGDSESISVEDEGGEDNMHTPPICSPNNMCPHTGGGGDEGGNDGLEMRELIGIIVGASIVVLMIVFCCALLICALLSRGGLLLYPALKQIR